MHFLLFNFFLFLWFFFFFFSFFQFFWLLFLTVHSQHGSPTETTQKGAQRTRFRCAFSVASAPNAIVATYRFRWALGASTPYAVVIITFQQRFCRSHGYCTASFAPRDAWTSGLCKLQFPLFLVYPFFLDLMKKNKN